MRTTQIAAPIVLAALSLAACNKQAAPAAKAPAAPAASSGVTASVEAPTRKAGLWEQTMMRDGKPAMGPMGGKVSLCLDAEIGAKMHVFGRQMGRGMCQQQSLTRNLDGSYAFASSCDFPGGGKAVSKGTANGDFNSRYVVRSDSDVTGAPFERMNGDHTMEMTAVWKGPCPAGMKPGDMLMGNGMKVNMAQMMGHHPGGSGPGAPAAPAGDN